MSISTSSYHAPKLDSLIRRERWDDIVAYLNTEKGREESIFARWYNPLAVVLVTNKKAPLFVIEAILKIFPNDPACYISHDQSIMEYAIQSLEKKRASYNIRRGAIPMSSVLTMLKACPESVKRNPTIINLAAQFDTSDNAELVKAILDIDPNLARPKARKGSENERNPLNVACRAGNERIIQFLLDVHPEGATFQSDDNMRYPLHDACTSNNITNPNLLNRLISFNPSALTTRDFRRDIPLHIACALVKNDFIPILIEANSSTALIPDYNGSLPLHLALYGCGSRHRNLRVSALQSLLEAYPKGVFHLRNDCKLAHRLLLHPSINGEQTSQSNDNDNDTSEEKERYESLRLIWVLLLKETCHQISHNCLNSGYKNCYSEEQKHEHIAKYETKSTKDLPTSMWHTIAIVSSLFTEMQFQKLLCDLIELKVVLYEEGKEQVLNDSNTHGGNTILHLLLLSFTKEILQFAKRMSSTDDTKKYGDDVSDSDNTSISDSEIDSFCQCYDCVCNDSDSDGDSDSDNHNDNGNGNDNDNDNHISSDDNVDFVDILPKSHLGILVNHFALQQESSSLMGKMSKTRNLNGELPLHILLRQPCKRKQRRYFLNDGSIDQMKKTCTKHINTCYKFMDMQQLVKYNPSSVSERIVVVGEEEGKHNHQEHSFMPFMIAAVHCEPAGAIHECTQCVSCIYELLRFGGIESCSYTGGSKSYHHHHHYQNNTKPCSKVERDEKKRRIF